MSSKDILLNFDNCKQKPPRHERKLDVSTVKLMFKESLKESTPVTHTILQLLVYAGLRRTVLSKLLRTDIVRTESKKMKILNSSTCTQSEQGTPKVAKTER